MLGEQVVWCVACPAAFQFLLQLSIIQFNSNMGLNSSKPEIEEMISRFNVRCRDEANNLTYLIDRSNNKSYMLKELFANDEASIKNIESELVRKKQMHHEHVAQLKEYYINLSEQFCSRIYSSGALYQIPFRTLEDERNDRLRSRVPFDENELWSILASSILGFAYLQRNFIQHESVRTSNIYVQDSGTIKISDPFAKQLPTNYQLNRQSRNTPGVYLSPAELRSYREQHKYPVHNSYKSDVFAMGAVMLELAFLEVQNELYNRNRATLNESFLTDQLSKFEAKYGEEIKKIVAMMMDANQNTRMDWIQLELFVKKQDVRATRKKRQGSSDISKGQIKPMTADVNSRKAESNSKNLQNSAVLMRSPQNMAGNFKREEVVKAFQLPSTSGPVVMNQPIINLQQMTPGAFTKGPPRAGRASQPPIRSTTDPSEISTPTPPNARIPAVQYHQHQPFAVPAHFPPQPHSFQKTPNQVHIVRNSNFQSQQVNNSQNSPYYVQTNAPLLVPTIIHPRGMSPLQNPKQQQLSQRQQGFSYISHSSQEQVITSQTQPHIIQVIPSMRKMHFDSIAPTPSGIQANNSTPIQALSHKKFSLRNTPTQEGEKIMRAQPTVSKFSVPLDSMEPSKIDSPCSSYGLPLEIYTIKTKEDENMVDKPMTNGQELEEQARSSKEKSFLSDQQEKNPANIMYKQGEFVSKPSVNSKMSNHSSSKNSFTNNAAKVLNNPRGSDSSIPISPPAGAYSKNFQKQQKEKPSEYGKLQIVKQTYKQGSRYQGEKYKGMRHGKGKFFYDDGGMYDGSWNMNRMEGFGKLFYVNGKLAYEGYWIQDHFNGQGKLYNDNPIHIDRFDYRNFDDVEDHWNTYEGQFESDLKNGKGVLVLQNGQRYQGNFKDDMVHGQGVFKGRDGVIRGIWNCNHLMKIIQ